MPCLEAFRGLCPRVEKLMGALKDLQAAGCVRTAGSPGWLKDVVSLVSLVSIPTSHDKPNKAWYQADLLSPRASKYGHRHTPSTVEARRLENDCPPTPKPREARKQSLNPPRPIFQLFGVHCNSIPWTSTSPKTSYSRTFESNTTSSNRVWN